MARLVSNFTAIALLGALNAAPAVAALLVPCDPEGAIVTEIVAHDADGVFRITEGYRIRLANIIWPDHLEPGQRAQLSGQIAAAIKDQRITWKPAAGPDRWGVTPAHLFLAEKEGGLAPFWLQAGLVEAGIVAAWPDAQNAACWKQLAGHEAIAIKARRGYWAPRAQSARHRTIEAAREAHAGRRIAAIWRVKSIRPWRTMHFVNFVPSFRGGPSIGLTRKQMSLFDDAQRSPLQWQGKWVVARFIVGAGGLSRLRVESIDHLGPID